MGKEKKKDNKENKAKKENGVKKIIIGLILIAVVIVALVVGYIAYKMIYKEENVKDIFENVETTEAIVSEYIVYGTHLNIKGNINILSSDVKSVSLELRTLEEENTKTIELSYKTTKNGLEFSTSDLINEGIDLEYLPINTYYLLIKIGYANETYKYYALKNGTDYENKGIEYYTITRNGQNNKIDIKFANRYKEEQNIEYMYITINSTKLPSDVYDIVIDPGHGGSDGGAESGRYKEADLTLKISKEITKELQKLGLKVKMTRDGTEGKDYTVYTVYDKNGRVNVVGDSKAKYVFSIHLNSVEQANSQSGVEIYAPTRTNLKFAKDFADNIVKYANTRYSKVDVNYRVQEGVFVRTLTQKSIKESAQTAKRRGYKPYDIKEDTPYLYMIRETGGIATGAYVDGRNPDYGTNLYCKSNIGVEAYLLELGYINNKIDLNNILNNQSGYVEGIVKTIKDNVLIEN